MTFQEFLRQVAVDVDEASTSLHELRIVEVPRGAVAMDETHVRVASDVHEPSC